MRAPDHCTRRPEGRAARRPVVAFHPRPATSGTIPRACDLAAPHPAGQEAIMKLLIGLSISLVTGVALLVGILDVWTSREAGGAGAAERGVYDRSDLQKIDYSGLPAPTTITARDGTPLAIRVYDSPARTAVLAIHGSSGDGRYYRPLARYLSGRGQAAVYAVDLRGHGASGGRRGDVDYIGQLEDDLADVVAMVRRERPAVRIVLLGHSAGGCPLSPVTSSWRRTSGRTRPRPDRTPADGPRPTSRRSSTSRRGRRWATARGRGQSWCVSTCRRIRPGPTRSWRTAIG